VLILHELAYSPGKYIPVIGIQPTSESTVLDTGKTECLEHGSKPFPLPTFTAILLTEISPLSSLVLLHFSTLHSLSQALGFEVLYLQVV